MTRSVPALFLALAFVGVGTGLLDIAINAQAAGIEARQGVRIMDGLHAVFSLGVVCSGVGAGLLRRGGAHPSWILGGVAVVIGLTALVNLSSPAPPERARRRAPLARPLLRSPPACSSPESRLRRVSSSPPPRSTRSWHSRAS